MTGKTKDLSGTELDKAAGGGRVLDHDFALNERSPEKGKGGDSDGQPLPEYDAHQAGGTYPDRMMNPMVNPK